jgi:hypothetical protein
MRFIFGFTRRKGELRQPDGYTVYLVKKVWSKNKVSSGLIEANFMLLCHSGGQKPDSHSVPLQHLDLLRRLEVTKSYPYMLF